MSSATEPVKMRFGMPFAPAIKVMMASCGLAKFATSEPSVSTDKPRVRSQRVRWCV
jgi:hypothetical protein